MTTTATPARPLAQIIPFPNATTTPPRPVRPGRYPKNVVVLWRVRYEVEREAARQARIDAITIRLYEMMRTSEGERYE